jgi:hypothetical protein
MRPRNFPERKNQRRKVALLEVLDRITFLENNPNLPGQFSNITQAAFEELVLDERIVKSARHIRTKKNRAGSVVGAKKRQE